MRPAQYPTKISSFQCDRFFDPKARKTKSLSLDEKLRLSFAGWTGLEPAASGVTGRRYNQLNYHPKVVLLFNFCRRNRA